MATRAGRSGPAGDSGQVLWSWRELGGNVSDDTLVSSCRHAHRPPAFERRAMQGHWRSQTIPCMGVSTRPNGFERSEEHTSELQSLMRISYAVFCLTKKI